MEIRTRSLWLLAWVLFVVSISCSGGGGTSSGPNPTPAPSGSPPADVANVAGTWRGTFESSNFATHTITLDVQQIAVNCVDGAWASDPPGWAGAISGLAGTGSFAGAISFEAGSGCNGYASISGEVGASTLTWTSAGFTVGSGSGCPQGIPQSVVLKLQRQ
jgi:hypothetical protein